MNIEDAKRKESEGYKIIYLYDSPHFAKLVDSDGRWVTWIKAPKNEKKRRETSKFSIMDVLKFHNFSSPFCFFCGRKEDELGVGEILELDHIVPLKDGGIDNVENLQILCTSCHKLKHHENTYITKHLIRKIKDNKKRVGGV